MKRTYRTIAFALAAALLFATAPASGAPAGLDAKRRDAERVRAEIARQGQRLSVATEEYNEAGLRRQGLDGKLARVRRDMRVAEEQWIALKAQLGKRVRYLYMHPGSWAI